MKCHTTRNCQPSFLDQLDRGLNRIVRDAMSGDTPAVRPIPLSVTEDAQRYVVECDLPGVPCSDVTLQAEDGILEVTAERRRAEPAEGATVLVDERSYTKFSRRLQLARDADAAAIDAEFGNGVLKITIPKLAALIPNKIQIRSVS